MGIPGCEMTVCHPGLSPRVKKTSGCDVESLNSLSLIMAGNLAGGKMGTGKAERRE